MFLSYLDVKQRKSASVDNHTRAAATRRSNQQTVIAVAQQQRLRHRHHHQQQQQSPKMIEHLSSDTLGLIAEYLSPKEISYFASCNKFLKSYGSTVLVLNPLRIRLIATPFALPTDADFDFNHEQQKSTYLNRDLFVSIHSTLMAHEVKTDMDRSILSRPDLVNRPRCNSYPTD